MSTKEKCFMIMPISTPEAFIPVYRDGKEHFKHVLDCLFIPAIEKAGFTPEPPIAKGSDLIHAEIIKLLEKAEIVLCDMSSLNPNVFFEFGIRTSLNKPVCVVKDELTKQVPFDAAILNYQEYDSSLDPWKLNVEIDKIASHLGTSAERSKGENTLWKYFGIKAEAAPLKAETDTDSKLDFLTNQIDALRQQIKNMPLNTVQPLDLSSEQKFDIGGLVWEFIEKHIPKGVNITLMEAPDKNGIITVYYRGKLSRVDEMVLARLIYTQFRQKVRFVFLKSNEKS